MRKVLGETAGQVLTVSIAAYCYLCCIGSFVIVADVVHPLAEHLALSHRNATDSQFWYEHRQVCNAPRMPRVVNAPPPLVGVPNVSPELSTSFPWSVVTPSPVLDMV